MRPPCCARVALARLRVVRDRNQVDVERLRSVTTPCDVAAGTVVITEGEDGDALYVVVEGELEISVRSAGDRTTVIGRVGPNGVVGEACLLSPGPATATVTAIGAASLLRLAREAFDLLCLADPPGALGILRPFVVTAASRLHEATVQLTAGTSEAHVAAAQEALHAG